MILLGCSKRWQGRHAPSFIIDKGVGIHFGGLFGERQGIDLQNRLLGCRLR